MTVEQSQKYMELVQSGVPAAEAFKQAYPNGLPTAQDRAKAASKQQQQNTLVGTAGLVGGVLGTKYLVDAIGGKAATAATTNAVANSVAPSVANAAIASAPSGIGPIASGSGYASSLAPSSFGLLEGNIAGTGLGALPLAGIAAGTYLGGKSLYNLIRGKEDNSLAGKAGRVTLGVATGGLSELARAFGLGAPSTRDIAKGHTKDLLSQGKDDKAWQSYVQGMRAQYNSGPSDPSKPFHGGQYGSWDEYKRAGLDANDLTGVYGNLKTFGPAWGSLNDNQRRAVTQGLIDAGLYDSKKGEVIVTDGAKAKAIYNQVIGNQTPQVAPKAQAAVNPKLQSAMNKQNAQSQLNLAKQIYG